MVKKIFGSLMVIVFAGVNTIAWSQTKLADNFKENSINLSGTWRFQQDSLDTGIVEKWFSIKLKDAVHLPGSMTTNAKGNDIVFNTPWTGSIFDSSYFFKPQYARYRQPGNIKVPFWLQPVKYYKGAAWYQKTITIPPSWDNKHLELFIERSHWETTVWIDDKEVGMKNSLGTAQIFDLKKYLQPGIHQLTIRVDNRVKDINVGENSHSISDHTQTNWNGMIGKLFISARPLIYIDNVQLFPDIKNKWVKVKMLIKNTTGVAANSTIQLSVRSKKGPAEKQKFITGKITIVGDSYFYEVIYPMGEKPLLWDEFHPNIYAMSIKLNTANNIDFTTIIFGMREFGVKGTQFTINGKNTFLRGTLECAIFPRTGYPPTDLNSWLRIFKIARSYGLNHLRFHSWCPPEAAFQAADRTGFYLQIECSSWANWGTGLGEGAPVDKYIYDESEAIVKAYGNHPSFCMLTYGNEPSGKGNIKYLTAFTNYWKEKDSRRLYTTGSGWPAVPDNDYNVVSEPRIQLWKAGLKSIINSQAPCTNYDWSDTIVKWKIPTVSHEIGQWCVYPDFKEIKKYTGILKAKNFEIFQSALRENGMERLADSFLLSSGKLQALCYKADIEAALRTPGFGGFQLLSLYDFPGQGTALVGILNAFWEDKGYITSKEYRMFCNSTVPLVRLPKMIYLNNERLIVPVEIAHFGEELFNDVKPKWELSDASGNILFRGELPKTNIPLGNAFQLGVINQDLISIKKPSQLALSVSVNGFINSWDIFVYPAALPKENNNILVTQYLDTKSLDVLNSGGKVLLTLKKGVLKKEFGGDIETGFSSIFWNTSWTNGQAPHTLGILCNPKHPALKEFPTQYFSNWQWWDAMSHSNSIIMDSVSKNLQPIVRIIDDWVTARPLGLLFECKAGKGKLLVSGIDLISNNDKRAEARQLKYSLEKYMSSGSFNPAVTIDVDTIRRMIN
ncbi:MAG: beta-galactosidase [Ferruginibacter sp.]|nr:beta-galactosidase [Ferruginibacter sp.]